MRAIAATVLLVCVAGAIAAEEVGPPAPAGGSLEVPERVHDAGKVDRGTAVKHTFLLKNVGTAELAIDAKPG